MAIIFGIIEETVLLEAVRNGKILRITDQENLIKQIKLTKFI